MQSVWMEETTEMKKLNGTIRSSNTCCIFLCFLFLLKMDIAGGGTALHALCMQNYKNVDSERVTRTPDRDLGPSPNGFQKSYCEA